MKMKLYLVRIEELKEEIKACQGLIDFYVNKKKALEDSLENMKNVEFEITEQ